jgi:hypothetical protein
MMTDALLQLSSAQAVTVTAVSTNAIDVNQARDLASGEHLYANFTVDTTALAAGAATVTFQLIASDSANLSSPQVLVQTDAIGKAELTVGRAPISIGLPQSALATGLGKRYLGVQYVVSTGPLTAGAFTACLSNAKPDDWRKGLYPSGFRVA